MWRRCWATPLWLFTPTTLGMLRRVLLLHERTNLRAYSYKSMHGKFVTHPFLDRRIPIICDGELVDMSFGTLRCCEWDPA